MYISYSKQERFHQYFENLVNVICEERIPGWPKMLNDPRPEKEWKAFPRLPESHWYWDNAATVSWLHYDCICKLRIQFIANHENCLKLESSGMQWTLSDEQMFSDEFVKDIICAYCSTGNADELNAKITEIVKAKERYAPNRKIIAELSK